MSDTPPIVPARILTIQLRELHIMREYVAVCWNLVHRMKTVTDDDGARSTVRVTVRACDVENKIWNQPYIDFVALRTYQDEPGVFLDEDSPVDGGISLEFAEEIRDELTLAIAYLRQVSEGH